jgi:serine/threonine protein kinase
VSESNPAARPEPTEIAGRYQIVQKLGAGAMGTVYKAKDKVLGRMVAIKTIRLEGLAASDTSHDELRERFLREAKVAANLKHPNIVTIYDFGEAAGLTYIAMEFIDGQGLDRIIRAGRLPLERAAALGIQVADALAVAHKHKVIHRDVKPANIMIEAGDRVKVTDFGIAKPETGEHLTMTGSILGTPSYMSPEQARANREIDGRSDLFSLGCILYEMVSGQKAFRGDTLTAIIFKIITEEPPPLRELDPNVPDEMVRIIAKALAKAPEARYQTGQEIADDLLALTRPGFVPTVRAVDSPTLPPDAAAGGAPTVVSPGTARAEATISSSETAARPAAAPAPPPPGGPPPLPPTILTPATARTPGPPPVPRPTPPRPPQAAVARAASAPRKGGGAGLLIGLAAVGLLFVVAVGLVGLRFLSKRSRAPVAAPVAEASPVTPPSPLETPAAPQAAEGTGPAPAPVSSATAPPPPPSLPPHASRPPVERHAESTTGPAPSVPPRAAGQVASSSPKTAPPAGGQDYSYLDQLPQEGPDGREVGEALASKYRSGGSSSYPTTRFNRRERFPRDLAPAERPAAATLAHILFAEDKFHAAHGRYGTFTELAAAQHLLLDVPFAGDSFQRARYRFRLTLQGDGFRAEATPIGPVGRPLVVDDNGFVQVDRD